VWYRPSKRPLGANKQSFQQLNQETKTESLLKVSQPRVSSLNAIPFKMSFLTNYVKLLSLFPLSCEGNPKLTKNPSMAILVRTSHNRRKIVTIHQVRGIEKKLGKYISV